MTESQMQPAHLLPPRRRSTVLVTTLPPSTFVRLGVDLGIGVAIATYVSFLTSGPSGWLNVLIAVIISLGSLSVVAILMCRAGLFLQELMAEPPRSRYAVLAVSLAICGTFIGLIVEQVGPGAAWTGVTAIFVAMPSAVFILVFGIWACVLTRRWVHACRYRWVRYGVDALIAALTALEMCLLFVDNDLLTTGPAIGLLFPVGAWLSIRTWRVMTSSRRTPVRAAADIALSLLLGVDLVLFLVWVANLVDLPKVEIVVLRGTLDRVGSTADLPWPLWVGLYILLAGTSLAFAFFPNKLARISQWIRRLHVVASIDASRRILSGVHISLLVTVLIAATAPASLEATLRGPLKANYTVALQRELESHGEQVAYERIRRQFNTDILPSVQPLVTIVSKIHSISSPPPGTRDATNTERDLASRIGQLQATTLQLTAAQSVLSTQQESTDLAKFNQPIHDAGDLNDRLYRLDAQQRRTATANKQVNQAAELATVAVANLIQIPGLAGNEIFQIIREYLSGLVENSPLKDVFAAWAEHLTGDTTQPSAEKIVVPDPKQLVVAAGDAVNQQQARFNPADPFASDPLRIFTQTESAAAAAVDLINETRYLEEHTDPCDGCLQPVRPGEEHYRGPGDHPVEPVKPVR